MIKVLIIGPIPEPTTGVSLANKVVLDGLIGEEDFKVDYINTSLDRFDEDLGAFSMSKIWFYFKLNFYAFKVLKSNIVYITPGQTFFGVVKYLIFIVLSKLSNKELIVHVHGNYLGKEYASLKGFKKYLFKKLLKFTSKGIVLSESLTGNMSPFISSDKIFVLYNFVENYLYPKDEFEIKEKLKFVKPKIVFLSNLMEEKGIFELLEALKNLEESGLDYEARIAGNIDSKNKNKISEYIDGLKNTNYIGVVSGNDKRELLYWSNVFVLPTYYKMEGQPISILEAMATGNIILTTMHAGIPDIFRHKENGFYVEKKNALSIAENIIYISQHKDMAENIMERNHKTAELKYQEAHYINGIKTIFKA